MDVFKLSVHSSTIYSITNCSDFEILTSKQKPWVDYEFTATGRRTRHYAVCPHCNNTIVMVGFNAGSKLKTPYGKHYLSRELLHLGYRDQDAYDACPYHLKGQSSFSPDDKYLSDNPHCIERLSKLIEHFDIVIDIIQKNVGVQFSRNCIEKMLTAYRASEGWLYKGASEQNIPWSFAYLTLSESLYGQTIHHQELREALLENTPGLHFEHDRLVPQKGIYFNAMFCFLDHQRMVVKHHLRESLIFSVVTPDRETLYQKEIVWETADFDSYIKQNVGEERRNDLVKLAREYLGFLLQ
ncbi:hypothetical protein [Vibrio parahaemolyticus]|uniref:hypothetical protein n=1 Tax=Vibrio parahaemolyticus TaxID=670 RepID=UPI0011EC4218|nr:hypothetical protein [Vibrio parahaemolyticus]KAB5597954.1 hypothetical protein F0578_19430 [Vibrio parahaemolyticus]